MRRMWMLLLVVTLMVIVLAIPAMAATEFPTAPNADGTWPDVTSCECAKAGPNGTCVEGCPGTNLTWTPVTATNQVPNSAGNYYLTADIDMQASAQTQRNPAKGSTIRLNLNGKTINPRNDHRIFRFANQNCTLVITDSVGTGSLKSAANYANAGILAFAATGGKFRMYAGTIDGTEYTANTNASALAGSLLELGAGVNFTMYGGSILGCTLTEDELAARAEALGVAAYYPAVAAVYKSSNAGSFTMEGGEIHGGFVQANTVTGSGSGAAIYNTGTGTINLNGGTVYGGTVVGTTGNGGAVYMNGGTLNINGATVVAGTANEGNGIYGVAASTVKIQSGEIRSGSATNTAATVYTLGTLNLSGGSVAGVVDASSATAVDVIGGIANLKLGEKTFTVSKTPADGTNVVISRDDAAIGTVVAENVTAYNRGIFYQDGQYMVTWDATAGTLSLQAPGVIVKGDTTRAYSDLAAAFAGAESGDYICLMTDCTGGVSFTGDLYLDLNGFDITGDITVTDGELYLMDSATADYSVADGNYGTVTGTVDGAVSDFTTAAIRAKYDNHNYRYVVVCVNGEYTSHRIYMTVKSTVLNPQIPALNYRTTLRCDGYLADLINAQGKYGVLLSVQNEDGTYTRAHGNYLVRDKVVQAYEKTDGVVTQENEMVTRLTGILDETDKDSEDNQQFAQTKVRAQAYLWIEDDRVASLADETSGTEAENTENNMANAQRISGEGVTSSGVNFSLKDLVVRADNQWTSLTLIQQTALGGMYGKWEALMEGWGLKNIPTMKDEDARYGCLCGDPDSTDNPCAENGHVEFDWEPWDSTTQLPTKTGNYYLLKDVELKAQLKVDTGVHININTNGHSITAPSSRVARILGIFNLTNYGYNGATVETSNVSGYGLENDIGGALLIHEGGNVSLYSNVTVKAADGHIFKDGLVYVSGSLNIYGGNITGADIAGNSGKGGAVNVASTGYMYMNAGTITGGTALQGGAIYTKGTFTLAGGTVKDGRAGSTNGTSTDMCGGNIYIEGGIVTLSGGTLSGGQAGFLQADGTLSYKNASNAKKGWGGNIYMKAGQLDVLTGASVSGGRTGGNGGSMYLAGGSFTMNGGTISGGQSDDQGGNLFIYNGATISGGKITGGKANYGGNIALGNNSTAFSVSLTNVEISGGEASSNGGNIRVQDNRGKGSLSIGEGTKIQNGWAIGTGGNIQTDSPTSSTGPIGSLTISGGTITGGMTGSNKSTNSDSANMMIVDRALTISGGDIDGGVTLKANHATCTASLTLTGAPKVDGSGLLLVETASKKPISINIDTDKLDRAEASVVLRTDSFVNANSNGILLTSTVDEQLAREILSDYAGFTNSEITYEETGIYLRKSTHYSQKWSCLCGANYSAGEDREKHVNGCEGYDEKYDRWTSLSLPDKPGNWYLDYNTKENAAGVPYVSDITTGTLRYDYYRDANGDYQPVFTMMALNTAGKTMTGDDGKYVTVTDYTVPDYAYTANPEYKPQTAAYIGTDGTVFAKGEIDVLEEYTIRVDLNGLKLETGKGYRLYSFRGIGTPKGQTTESACRNANVTLNILDSSDGHTGSVASYGVYTGVTADGKQTLYSDSATHWQSHMIWMTHSWDTLNTSYITIDASSTITGVGPALYVDGGKATFWNSTVIGGTAQGCYRNDTNKLATKYAEGGGAIAVYNGGTVTVNGSTVKNGTAIYRTVTDTDNMMYDQAVGGGNIFVSNGTLNLIDATVTGGKALIYAGTDQHYLPSYSYGSGGGIYMLDGDVNISGNTVIKDNYTGTISNGLLDAADGNNFYNCVDVHNATVNASTQNNLFLGGNALTLDGLTGEVHYSMTGVSNLSVGNDDALHLDYNLKAGGHVGTFATYTGTAPTADTLKCDDTGAPKFEVGNNKVYYPAESQYSRDQVYQVGYGKASVHPSDAALKAGLVMTNYGPGRNTADVYNHTGDSTKYYDIVNDPNQYIQDIDGKKWNTKCYATALATTDGEGDTVIIIALDGQTHTNAIAAQVKRMVSYATGVPQDNITISSGHQHSIPGPTTIFNADGTIVDNYAGSYYSGIVQAAVAAMTDRQQATVKVGTLDTTAEGKQYNFVRNIVLKDINGNPIGMLTDNYRTHWRKIDDTYYLAGGNETISGVERQYESQADTTLQLVEYTQDDGNKIVMANFQTHPHLGAGAANKFVHSDVIGAFRYYLEELYSCDALYFSGGGGNVNTTTSIEADREKYPYDDDAYSDYELIARVRKANDWGKSLATMASSFLGGTDYTGSAAMTEIFGSNDVAVTVQNYAGKVKTTDASLTAIEKVAQIRKWTSGDYKTEFLDFNQFDIWKQYVTDPVDRTNNVYSSFDSGKIREALLYAEAGHTVRNMTISAYAMGEIGFVAAPYEMFHENGTQIKTGSAGTDKDYAMTIVATLANGSNSYIPSVAGYANEGYSTDQSYFDAGTGEELADKFVDMLNGLK